MGAFLGQTIDEQLEIFAKKTMVLSVWVLCLVSLFVLFNLALTFADSYRRRR